LFFFIKESPLTFGLTPIIENVRKNVCQTDDRISKSFRHFFRSNVLLWNFKVPVSFQESQIKSIKKEAI